MKPRRVSRLAVAAPVTSGRAPDFGDDPHEPILGAVAPLTRREPDRWPGPTCGRAVPSEVRLNAAALSWVAALIHALVAPDHFAEYWLFGVLFVAVAAFQFSWGVVVFRRPSRRAFMWAGGFNLAVAVVWLLSRTVGPVLGPEPWQNEGLGALDVAATVDELAILATAFAYLRGYDRWLGTVYRTPVAPLLIFASLLAAMGGHRQ